MKPAAATTNSVDDDDAPDEWDQRIIDTGCHKENMALHLCHFDKGDWRQCAKEMAAFRECWAKKGNDQRTATVQNDEV